MNVTTYLEDVKRLGMGKSTKRALILGITGQDGSYLAENLLQKGYCVHGLVRHSSHGPDNLWRIQGILDRVTLHEGDLTDTSSLVRVYEEVQPDELYNEADQDHVGFSFSSPSYSMDVTAGGVARILEIVRQAKRLCRVFQPVSATMFGNAPPPQNESTPFAPQSPYACAKVAAYYLVQHYRREYGMWVATAILYNHDSVRRTGDYLLHRICRAAVQAERNIKADQYVVVLDLGDLDTEVDVGWAPEYVEGIHQIMQMDKPDDYVLSSGTSTMVREIARHAYGAVGLDYEAWITSAPSRVRPGPRAYLLGDSRKARRAFGWKPMTHFTDLIDLLIAHYRKKHTLLPITVPAGEEATDASR